MSLFDWIPAISSTSLLAGALWLMRSVISTRLRAGVQHEFDQKIETLKAELRKNEESFKADLRSKETQIEALRSGALSTLASRQAALDARRIQAVDQLWSAFQALGPAKSVSATIAILKFEEATKFSVENPKAREVLASISGDSDPRKVHTGEAEKARPFVSEMAWAIFSAYRAILSVAMIKMQLLKNGLDMPHVIDEQKVRRLITVVLPHQANFIAQHDTGTYYFLLDELESLLLHELRRVLQGAESDKEAIKQAREILRESENIMSSLTERTEGSALES
jgi:hypothetical protein